MIRFTQSRTVTWACPLCTTACTIAEKDYDTPMTTYVCICGRIYTVHFSREITIEENWAMESIFTIDRDRFGLKVRLISDPNKGCFIALERDEQWQQALEQAIGRCWRVYGKDIIAHIKAMPEESQS